LSHKLIASAAPGVLNQELKHFVGITNAAAILYHPTTANGTSLLTPSESCPLVKFPVYNGKRPGSYKAPFTLSNRTLNPLRIGWLLFTSGTTSVPKAVLHYRKAFIPVLLDHIERFKLTEDDVGIMQVAGHWMRGVSGQLMFLLSGSQIEYIHDDWTAKWMWERMSISPVTCFLGKARDFYALAAYHKDHLKYLAPKQLMPYTTGLRNLRLPISAGVPLTGTVRDAWNCMEGHNHLINEYGSTETFNMMAMCPGEPSISAVRNSIAVAVPSNF
jgi:acyl-coenzyme A synthetase/AMP-(fatty) acid ligase